MPTNHAASLNLLAPIASFFASETTDPRAVARYFADDAVVLDEGHAHRGRAAIAAWHVAVVARYAFSTEPLSAETAGARTTVTAKVSGSFPGSPAHLRFAFTVAGHLITRLEIGS
ncbi:nuclear transport factor 2 family protein [Myxococcus sp. AM009]|uniref:nuclear transport factor 2 family protein n=1 Tax=Myxococcus sp. AM010 TaxID=2745138 RepID=UPI001595DC9D|nr:nuclear transport factor 2 family protein [Myxococcus sp. AM010]NVJ02444.1 nuclear transport factor 2 family protein [Myxococcus sp. AM009]NVJ18365.1 nuclear transport factor 2 family protein [Myxococcus sp. AM010]